PDQDTEEKLYPLWDGFLSSLVHWAVIEEKFSYILYVGFGDRRNLCWKDGLVCSYKIIAFSPWPSGFNEIPDLEHVWRRRCLPAFDGSWGTQYIREESKCLRLKDALIVPYTVKADFLQMSAFQRESSDFSPESRLCLEMLCHRLFPEEKQREAKDRKLIFREEF
ncbi:MAG: hypothetical protein FWH49_03435, partial [Clostridiales bacterium]|nr:hypothetical protein [Clostridiales bacterium]